MKKIRVRTGARIISAILLHITLLSTASCGKIKDLSPYKEEFKALIEESFEINEILFGVGLPVYSRDESLGELRYSVEKNEEFLAYFKAGQGKDYPESLYTDNEGKFRIYHWIYRDPVLTKEALEPIYVVKYRVTYYVPEGVDEEGKPDYDMVNETFYALKRENGSPVPAGIECEGEIYRTEEAVYYAMKDSYKEPEFEYEYDANDNVNYDVVRLDCGYLGVDDIKAAAEKVYSKAYLNSIYSSLFDGIRSDYGDSSSSVLLARYIEEAGEEGGVLYLRMSNVTEAMFEAQRVYDYDTMQIVKPYNKDRVNVTVTANGVYFSSETKKIENGPHEVRLSFVLENGKWRLDSPTY